MDKKFRILLLFTIAEAAVICILNKKIKRVEAPSQIKEKSSVNPEGDISTAAKHYNLDKENDKFADIKDYIFFDDPIN